MRLFEKWRREFWPTVVSATFILSIVVFVNWEASKARLGEAMEGLGIAWTNSQQVTDGDKLNFITSVALAALAGWVALLGVQLNRRANQLAVEQAQHADAERARKADLRLYLRWEHNMLKQDGQTRWVLEFAIANDGDRDARDVRWELRIPYPPTTELNVTLAPWTASIYDSKTETVVLQAVAGARVIRAAYQGAIYSGQEDVSACVVRFDMPGAARPAMKVGFYLTSAEGRFPAKGDDIIDVESAKVEPPWLQSLSM